MRTISLQTNQHRLIANLRHAFTPRSMLGELLQNARRAKAKRIDVTVYGDTLTVSDNGCGIADLQTLIFIAESGWDEQTKSRENAFGLGVLSTLYFAITLSVHSGEQAFEAETAAIINGDAITIHTKPARKGTEIRLTGVPSPDATKRLRVWVAKELERLCQAFPVPVFCNGVEIARRFADKTLSWRKTRMGKVLIDLSALPKHWHSFLQGLPIGEAEHYRYHVVLLLEGTLAKLPDRQHLLNAGQDKKRIQAAVNIAYREALIEAKANLSARDFVEQHTRTCLDSDNADLLNDVPLVPLDWFRNWKDEPAGHRKDWEHCHTPGFVSREEIEARGVWRIDYDQFDEYSDTFVAQVYLETAQAYLLEEWHLNRGHWLYEVIQTVEPSTVQVRHGAVLHRDDTHCLEDGDLQLVLVEADSLYVGIAGQPEYRAQAVRQSNVLYLTAHAGAPTRLVADYIINDQYEEMLEDEDAERIRTFVAIGYSDSPADVLDALLPQSLRYTPQAKLANATIHLTFNDQGKLVSVA